MARQLKRVRGIFEREKGSGVWWIRYADQYGRIHIEKVGLRQTAVHLYRQRKTEIQQGKFDSQLIRRKNYLMSEIIKDREEQAKGLKSFNSGLRTELKYWLDELGEKPVRSVLSGDIEAKRRELQRRNVGKGEAARPMKPATVNRYLAELKKVFSLAIQNGKADKNPVRELKLAKENNERVRYLSDEEESRLFEK